MNDGPADFAPGLEGAFALPAEGGGPLRLAAGALPTGLRGTCYWNGPARFERGGLRYRHWLDGDGMIAALTFGSDGRVTFANRFVRSAKWQAEEAAGRPLFRTFGTRFEGDRLARGIALESPVNVSVIPFGDTLIACGEQGVPCEIDPQTLATRGPFTFGGGLNAVSPFAAHAKIDPLTGDLYNFGLSYARQSPCLHLYRFAAAGGLIARRRVPLALPVSVHDFLLAPRHLVFHLSPYCLDLDAVTAGGACLHDALRWQPERASSELLIVPRTELAAAGETETRGAAGLHGTLAGTAPGQGGTGLGVGVGVGGGVVVGVVGGGGGGGTSGSTRLGGGAGEAAALRVPLAGGYCLHGIAAGEDEAGRLVIDLLELDRPVYDQYQPVADLLTDVGPGRPVRLTVDVQAGRIAARQAIAYQLAPDFPVVVPRADGRAPDDFWTLGIAAAGQPGRKFYDQLVHGTWRAGAPPPAVWQAPPGRYLTGEPAVAPLPAIEPAANPAGAASTPAGPAAAGSRLGGAVLVCPMYDAGRRESGYLLFDAADITAGPCAEILLGRTVPPAFHAAFVATPPPRRTAME